MLYFWCGKKKKPFSSSGTLNQTSNVLETHERAHTHTLSSYSAVQPRLAEDSCLQLSVITFYLFKRYLWMWANSLYSDPLYFYYLQDEIRAGLLRRTGSATSPGHIRWLRPGTEGHRKASPALQDSAAPTWARAIYRCTLCSLHCGFLEKSHGTTEKHKKNASSAQHLACLCRASQALPQGSHKSDSR